MKFADLPEQAFLEDNPVISPIEMITAVLWQVSGNLELIHKVANKWNKSDATNRSKEVAE